MFAILPCIIVLTCISLKAEIFNLQRIINEIYSGPKELQTKLLKEISFVLRSSSPGKTIDQETI